ncbi:MAG: SAM-dependent chlorinase/fluorinase [Deltaproteobacteria bacterium]|nr:SAM-dependent chlorinase/fluorinase [Deltaproteobacteria bacterium]MBW2076950.1 SAM-dependent chlorinase/fluorinase [Deltaproteobacteria bacterium]MBW2311308.1 SAM-dependent chlorinase/fluorinase [Deltaproteobacteria bacterium]
MKPSEIITLTTDFGQRDPYVAMMKGVILSINPRARIVDITHDIRAGSIQEGSTIIAEAYPFFPSGSVHVGVIDPGVGGKRRPIAVAADGHFFVGPDNGLFWPVVAAHPQSHVIHLTEKSYWMDIISATFHGRDIFAPVASHLSCGIDPNLMGEKVDNPVVLTSPRAWREQDQFVGEVIRVDGFGNLITNITVEELAEFRASEGPIITIGGLALKGIRTTYSDVGEGEALALIGSSNLLEIAVNRGSARAELGDDCGIGAKVIVRFED